MLLSNKRAQEEAEGGIWSVKNAMFFGAWVLSY